MAADPVVALAQRLEAAVTALHMLGTTAKDYDAHTQAKGVLERRLYAHTVWHTGFACAQRH
jgi:hypothetical protein